MSESYLESKDAIFTALFHKYGNSTGWRQYMSSLRAFLVGSLSKHEFDSTVENLLNDRGIL